MKRGIVELLARADELIDDVVYRPAVVRAFRWLPRWWQCDLARVSMRLDDRWATGCWPRRPVPGPPCEACGRRAAWLVVGGRLPDDDDDDDSDFFAHRAVSLCGWCNLPEGRIDSEEELRVALAAAGAESVAWRWR